MYSYVFYAEAVTGSPARGYSFIIGPDIIVNTRNNIFLLCMPNLCVQNDREPCGKQWVTQ